MSAKRIKIANLTPHPDNETIYGVEGVDDLAAKIKAHGLLNPIEINQDNVVISGHRRIEAYKLLGKEFIPYTIVETKNDLHLLELVLLHNEYRAKDTAQKLREGQKWEEIEAAKGLERKSQGGKGGVKEDRENLPYLDKGRVRDKIAAKLNIGSGRTYEAGKKVISKVNYLKEKGENVKAKILTDAVNKSVSAAKDLSQSIDDAPAQVIEQLQKNEITARQAVQIIKPKGEQRPSESKPIEPKQPEFKGFNTYQIGELYILSKGTKDEAISELRNLLKEPKTEPTKDAIDLVIEDYNSYNCVQKDITGKTARKLVKAILKRYTAQNIKDVFALKFNEWNSTDMQKYFVLETLLRASNFEKYYDTVKACKENKSYRDNFIKSNNNGRQIIKTEKAGIGGVDPNYGF